MGLLDYGQNTSVSEKTYNTVGAHRFHIEIDGVIEGGFKSMSGLGSKQDVIEYKLGGDRSVRRKPGRVVFNNITLERGYTTGTEFMDWRKSIIEGTDDRKNGAIIILNDDGTQAARWDFFRAWPVSWEGPGLTAGAAETAIEKLELAVEWVEQGTIS
jgi:phage tail-like protein